VKPERESGFRNREYLSGFLLYGRRKQMAEEGKTVTEEVTDEDLSKAYEEFAKGEGVNDEEGKHIEEETPGEKTGEAEGPDVIDQKESSKLGRKYKKMESELEQMKEELRTLKGGTSTVYQPPQDDEAELEQIREMYQTDPIAARRAHDAYDRKQAAREAKVYESAYLSQLNALAKKQDTEELHDEIVAEMMQNFNVRHSNNPDMDARVNYAEAKSVVIAKSTATTKKRPATAGGTEKAPVQPAANSSKGATKSVVFPQLDEYAQDYVNYLRKQGVTDEEILKSLK
jgi:hypothetical protein